MTESIISLVTITLILFGSPGPAPIALAATGAQFGVRQSRAFLFGILSGLSLAMVMAWLGLSAILNQYPSVKVTFQLFSVIYLSYLAFKIAAAPYLDNKPTEAPRFSDGFLLNIINPKAYASLFAIFSQFSIPLPQSEHQFAFTAIICILVVTLVDTIWLIIGKKLGEWCANSVKHKIMSGCFAAMMLAVALLLLKQF